MKTNKHTQKETGNEEDAEWGDAETQRNTGMKRYLLTILVAGLMAGCASPVILTVKDGSSSKPLEGIHVERYHPVSIFGKIINPIAATYDPLRLAESKVTGKNGEVTFRKLRAKSMFRIYPTNAQSLVVGFLGQQIYIDPKTNNASGGGWGCSIRIEKGEVKHSAWPIRKDTTDSNNHPCKQKKIWH